MILTIYDLFGIKKRREEAVKRRLKLEKDVKKKPYSLTPVIWENKKVLAVRRRYVASGYDIICVRHRVLAYVKTKKEAIGLLNHLKKKESFITDKDLKQG